MKFQNQYLAAHEQNNMNWEQLLSLKRYGDTHKRLRKEQDETRLGFDTHKRLRKEQDETRLGFEVDYDRIIFSSACSWEKFGQNCW